VVNVKPADRGEADQITILRLAPPSGASRAEMEPPCASATCRAKLSPTPLPPLWVV